MKIVGRAQKDEMEAQLSTDCESDSDDSSNDTTPKNKKKKKEETESQFEEFSQFPESQILFEEPTTPPSGRTAVKKTKKK